MGLRSSILIVFPSLLQAGRSRAGVRAAQLRNNSYILDNKGVMIKRHLVFLALLPLFWSGSARAQYGLGLGASQAGLNSGDCGGGLLGPGTGCFPGQTQTSQTGNLGAMGGAGQSSMNFSQSPAGLNNPYSLDGVTPYQLGYMNYENYPNQLSPLTPPTQSFPPAPPTEFQTFVAATTGQSLRIYGATLFQHVPSTFAPSNQSPVPPDYVVGPGDLLRVRIWGQINFSSNLPVDRDGDIYLPQVGTVPVAGLPFSEVDAHLRAAIAKLYRNFDLSVEMGGIRTIQVYVSGEARRPGAYTISSLSSLVDALFATGGPSPQGSMRHILLKRGGKVVADFDLYGLLLYGDKSKDVRLQAEDVIYIPPMGAEVAIFGSIRTPAIYELAGHETIGQLIKMAGGTTAVAAEAQISLESVDKHSMRYARSVAFDSNGLGTALDDGDIVRINSILPAYAKTVTLRGNVANPGHFGWYAGMRLSDLLPNIDSLVSRNYWWQRSHLGLPAPEFEPTVNSLGQEQEGALAASGGGAPISQNALTQALTNAQNGSVNAAEIGKGTGAAGAQSGAAAAAGAQSGAAGAGSNAANTLTPAERGSNASIASEMTPVPSANGSTVAIHKTGVRLSPDEINWSYAVIERIDPKSLRPSLIPFDLGKLVLEHDKSQDLELQPGDVVTIFSQSDIRVPLDQQVKYIELEGEFMHPGFYSVKPGETLRDVVRRAGGLTQRAYLYGSEFTRVSTRELQQQRLNDYVREITLEAEQGTQAFAISPNPVTVASAAASQAATQEMLKRLGQIKATGRIVLQFHPASTSLTDIPPIDLENGDKFVVPFAPTAINVVGAVYDQSSYIFSPGRTLGYYLNLAGGASRNADARHAFLIRADGSVVSRNHMPDRGFWKSSFADLKMNPGDTIVVPDKTLKPSTLSGVIEWSQIFSQFALGVAAVQLL
jgi:protein involved in polysaccharide export with SLBB domain